MSWSNFFYPGNPARRDEIVRHVTKFKILMEFNFDSTNDLIDMLNRDANPSTLISKIYVNNGGTIKDNCQTLLDKMDEIMGVVNKIDEELAQQLDPEAYRQLNTPDINFADKIAVAKRAVTAGLSVAATVAGIVIIGLIKNGVILTKIVTAIGVVKACAMATIAMGVLFLGIDMIASAIIGAVERNRLDNAIDELKDALKTFEPASKDYTKAIVSVQMDLERNPGDE